MCSLPPEYSLLHMTKWCLHSQWSCPQVLLHGWCFLGVDTFWGNRKYFEETTVHLPDKCIHPPLSPLCSLPGICNRALTPDHRETATDKLIHELQRHFSTLFVRKHTWWLFFYFKGTLQEACLEWVYSVARVGSFRLHLQVLHVAEAPLGEVSW